jgi:hypothetical protein
MKLSRFLHITFVLFFAFSYFSLFTHFPTVHAQNLPIDSGSLSLTTSSDSPEPGQVITFDITSYLFNINAATIVWLVDGKQVQKGIGLLTLNVQTPSLGKKKTITATAVNVDGSAFTKSYVLSSGYVDMIMETDGYASPLFKGKVPLVFQNTATIVAVPHLADSSGKEYDPTNLVYQWKKDDGTAYQSESGYGKQSISLKGSIIPRPYYIAVTVSTRDGSALAKNIINILPTSPSVSFYVDDPLYGPLFNKSIGDTLHIGSQKEARVFASLFGFNFSKNISSDLNLEWNINGTDHPELSSSNSVTLRAPNGISGTSAIGLVARGVDNILQGINSSFNVSFAAGASSTSTPITF